MLKKVTIDATLISSWDSFHELFKATFGFPEFYGRNMDAWIDCMSYLNDEGSGMTTLQLEKGDTLVIELVGAETLKQKCPEIYLALFECTAFVNSRIIESDQESVISLSAR